MGVLDRFEKGVERVVNNAFSKVGRSEVKPVELASALRREVDDRAAVVAGATLPRTLAERSWKRPTSSVSFCSKLTLTGPTNA